MNPALSFRLFMENFEGVQIPCIACDKKENKYCAACSVYPKKLWYSEQNKLCYLYDYKIGTLSSIICLRRQNESTFPYGHRQGIFTGTTIPETSAFIRPLFLERYIWSIGGIITYKYSYKTGIALMLTI